MTAETDGGASAPRATGPAGLSRRLGTFDISMIVMGGIIGTGIFANPSVVAGLTGSAPLAIAAWGIGGAIALTGAFVYAELAGLRPELGGQYAYLRDAFHPAVAFLYGWTLLLVIQTGGMAASALVFGRYARDLMGIALPEQAIAALTLLALTVVNALGVRAGGNVQNTFMTLKLLALAALIVAGLSLAPGAARASVAPMPVLPGGIGMLLPAMVPVIFAYGGWQTASFLTGEVRDPRRHLARGMLIGVAGVVLLYLLVNIVCIRALGIDALAATKTPASDVMRAALGATGGRVIAASIALSTVGFLSQAMLTAPRVYHAMAADGLFFRAIGTVHSRTKAPVGAIVLQGAWAAIIATVGRFEQILNYVVSIDTIFFGLTGVALMVFRQRARSSEPGGASVVRVPGHPLTTGMYVLVFWAIGAATVWHAPTDSAKGVVILALGLPAYALWSRSGARRR